MGAIRVGELSSCCVEVGIFYYMTQQTLLISTILINMLYWVDIDTTHFDPLKTYNSKLLTYFYIL
jgi:hypothetical protein